MGFFSRIFKSSSPVFSRPDIKFGRYSDSYKTNSQYRAWDLALEKFEQENYLASFKAFFQYLRDDDEDNVRWNENNGLIEFELLQGSRRVLGEANARKFKAEARIAKATQLNPGFMKRLMEANYDLKYGRFALNDDNEIVIIFDTYTLDSSPYKLYFALKEIATQADKQDDLLVDEFGSIEQLELTYVQEIPHSEKETRYNLIRQNIADVLQEVKDGKLQLDQYPGAIAYLLLELCYKLDYLISPEGYMMEALERIHRRYFEKDGKPVEWKNEMMQNEFEKILQRPKDLLFNEMYRIRSTFGITVPVNHDRVVSFIEGELHNMDWYKENDYQKVAMAIPGYIAGYCLFNYAMPQPDKEFFQLYFRIIHSGFFKELGFEPLLYNVSTGKFDRRSIKTAIQEIVMKYRKNYPGLKANSAGLNFHTPADLAKSYLLMIRDLDLTRID